MNVLSRNFTSQNLSGVPYERIEQRFTYKGYARGVACNSEELEPEEALGKAVSTKVMAPGDESRGNAPG